MQINVEVPEQFVLESSSDELARRLMLYAALRMFQSGEVSAGGAAHLASVDRFTFAAECKRHGVPLIDYSPDELHSEIESFHQAS